MTSILLATVAARHATGQTPPTNFTWNGSSDDDELWSNGDNWDDGDAPTFDLDGGLLIFGETGEEQSPDAGSDDYTMIGGLRFTAADESLRLIGSGSLSFLQTARIINDSLFDQTINIDLIANGLILIIDADTAKLAFGGQIDLSGDSEEDMATLRLVGDSATTISGRIVGEGAVHLVGSGLVTLSGDNDYTGGTLLGGGATLLLGHDNALGMGDLTVAMATNNTIEAVDGERTIDNDVVIQTSATLVYSGDDSLTLDGVISGEGSLVVDTTNSEALLTLNGENTFEGDTRLNSGTIRLGNDAALGEGSLILGGDGTLRSTSGERVIENDIFLNNHDLRVEGINDLELAGVLTDDMGGGSLTKAGVGTLELSGLSGDDPETMEFDATFTGLIRVNNGGLHLSGSVGGDINVNSDGILFGDGSLDGTLNVNDEGTLRIGNSIGTFTVGTDFTLAGTPTEDDVGGTLVVELSGDDLDSDMLVVGGDAVLEDGSTIKASIVGDCYIPSGQDFTIISAASITDNGVEIVTESVTVTVELVLDGDFVGDGSDTVYALELFRAPNAYQEAAFFGTNRTIGEALDSLQPIANATPKGDAGGLLAQLDRLNEADYNTAVSQLSPEPYNAMSSTVVDAAQTFTTQQSTYFAGRRSGVPSMVQTMHPVGPSPGRLVMAVNDPTILAAAFAAVQETPTFLTENPALQTSGDRWSNYVKFQGVFSSQDTTNNRTGYDASFFGGQVGVDYSFSPNLIGGLALGYTSTSADLQEGLGDLDDETLRAGPYVSWTKGNVYVDGSLTFGYHFYDGTRNIPALDRVAESDYDGFDVTGYVGAGYQYEIDRDFWVTPIVSMQYSYFDFDSFTETGAAGANLSVAGRNVDSLRSRFGANLSCKLDWGVELVPYFFLGWEHEFFEDQDVESTFAAGGSPFVIDTGSPSKDAVFVGGGVNVLLKHNVSAFIRYEGSYSADSTVSGIAAGVSIGF